MTYKYALCAQNELTTEDFSCLSSLKLDLTAAHPKRQSSYLAARKALQKLVPQKKLSELQLNEFHFLADFPQYVFSLAHTKDLAIAVMAEKKDYRSVGVDIEFLDRQIKDDSERHFINAEDERTLDHLELWCAKEAAFKASSFLYSKNFVLKDIWIKTNQFGHIENNSVALGEIKILKVNQMLIAVALLK